MPKKLKKINKNNLAAASHIKFLDKLEDQAVLGYKYLMEKLSKDVKKILKKEKLSKSDDEFTKLPKGWTGDIPQVEADMTVILDGVLTKYTKALEWIMLGGYADKDALKAAKDIGLTKVMIPGVTPSAYLQSIDTHRSHHEEVTGETAPELPQDLIKNSFDEIKSRSLRSAEEFGLKLRNRIMDAVEMVAKQLNFKNLNLAHVTAIDSLQADGAERAITAAAEGIDERIKTKDIDTALDEVIEKLEGDWSRTIKTDITMSSAVATHQAILEIYGTDEDDLTVVIQTYYDNKVCDFCETSARKPDGSYKKYKIKDFQPAGYNFNRKKADWKLCIPQFHFNCRCLLTYLPRGFDIDNDGNFIPKIK